MCGIVGYFSEHIPIAPKSFDNMRDELANRGPDGAGSNFFLNNRVALGHRRLSIIDLSELGSQPMCNEDGTVWLTYNGEIYNHLELAKELKSLGHSYKSSCDAETIIHAWEQWGDDCVLKFRGIFAFCLWDSRNNRVFCARDHMGVKPFYYTDSEEYLAIASQPRALLKLDNFTARVDENSFGNYLFFGVVPHNKAVFRDIRKLPPGHKLTYHQGKLEVQPYWSLRYQPEIFTLQEAKEALSASIEDAVVSQLMSDVPYGTYLSGGVDSSLITAIAAKHSEVSLPTISVGFREKKHNELPYARLVADYCGTNHTEEILDYSTAMGLTEDLVEAHDEPYALGAGLPLVHIARQTKAAGLKVVLSGDGADELFAGYTHYEKAYEAPNEGYLNYKPHEALIHSSNELMMPGRKVLDAIVEEPRWRYDQFKGHTGNNVLDTQLLDSRTYLPDEILVKVDRASMRYGVEVRVPFLDQRLVDMAFKIDHRLIFKGSERKALLKSVANEWLPQSVLTQRKKGFSIPISRWMLRPENWLKMYFTVRNGALADLDLIDAERFNKRGMFLPAAWMWKYYVAELWAGRWIKN